MCVRFHLLMTVISHYYNPWFPDKNFTTNNWLSRVSFQVYLFLNDHVFLHGGREDIKLFLRQQIFETFLSRSFEYVLLPETTVFIKKHIERLYEKNVPKNESHLQSFEFYTCIVIYPPLHWYHQYKYIGNNPVFS